MKRSADGVTWPSDTEVTVFSGLDRQQGGFCVYTVGASDHVIASAMGYIKKSTDNGSTFSSLTSLGEGESFGYNNVATNASMDTSRAYDDNIYVAANRGVTGIYLKKSINDGTSWATYTVTGLTSVYPALTRNDSKLFCFYSLCTNVPTYTQYREIYVVNSTDWGKSWGSPTKIFTASENCAAVCHVQYLDEQRCLVTIADHSSVFSNSRGVYGYFWHGNSTLEQIGYETGAYYNNPDTNTYAGIAFTDAYGLNYTSLWGYYTSSTTYMVKTHYSHDSGIITSQSPITVTITSPTTIPIYSTRCSTVNLSGVTYSLEGVSRVEWMNMATGANGTANGTTDWNISDIALNEGSNLVYVNATDSKGNTSFDTLTVIRDITNPICTIVTPAVDPYYTSEYSVYFNGTSSDNIAVTSVIWSNSHGDSGTCTGTTNWSATVPITARSDLITIIAYDAAGGGGSASITLICNAPYIPHTPISINGNADFAAQADINGWPGNGTESNPFVIEGLDIDATGYGIAMLITNTNVFFKVLNCYLHDTYTVPGIGIDLSGVSNGYIANNNCPDGIAIYSYSSNNFIFNNTCYDEHTRGIELSYSSNNTILKNTCRSDHQYGISLFSNCSNNVVADNICYDCFGGISLSSYCINNTFYNNFLGVIGAYGFIIFSKSACNNRIWNNSFYRCFEISGLDDGTNNWWNSSDGYGNWWDDLTGPDSALPWGIVDIPYNISGTANAKDYYPRTYDMIPPICTITTPTSAPILMTNWNMMSLKGIATDDIKVVSVIWNNSLGGSGIAYMTPQFGGENVSWQSRGNVMLFDGDNIITVTAIDNNGHSTTDTITVTYETVLPTVKITSPTSSSHYSISSSSIDLAGSASDASGIASVVWRNVATGVSGMTSGTTSWSIAGIALNLGMNLIYVNTTDNAGNKNYDAIWVTCDLDSLVVTITDPTSDPTIVIPGWHMVKLKGTASDDNKVVLVTWSNAATGDSGNMYMTPQWGGPSVTWETRGYVHIISGINVITVTAYDSAGNTATDVLTVTYTGVY